MKAYLLTTLFLLVGISQSFAQKHEFIFYTKDGGMDVYVNDQLEGDIGKGGKYAFKVRFDEENPSYTLRLSKEGFEDKEFKFDSKPSNDYTKVFWAMQKKRYRLREESNHTFDLARVKFDIEKEKQISTIPGKTAYWGSIGIEESNVDVFKEVIHEDLKLSGFQGLIGYDDNDEEENLFEEKNVTSNSATADISIGAIIKNMKIGGKSSIYSPDMLYDLSVEMEVEWQFYDNASQKLLIKEVTKESSFMVKETGELVRGINLAFAENFGAALRNLEVVEAILNVEPGASKDYNETVLKQYSISNNDPKTFESYGKMIKSVNPSVVTLKGDKGHGSGFVVSEDGYILTNYHVIKNNKNIKALFQMGFELPVEILNHSEEFDLVLLKVVGSGYNALSLSDSKTEIGDDVIAIGTPNSTDLSNTVTKGIISGKRDNENGIELIQTDVSVSPGNSGGPLINSDGLVIGIISQKLVANGTEGIAFAIPIEFALDKLNIRLKKGVTTTNNTRR